MAIKVLLNEGPELRIRITGESHTALQMFRSRLNDSKDVEYANYFVGHPELDEPEFYLRCKKGKDPAKILKGAYIDYQFSDMIRAFTVQNWVKSN